MTLTDIRARLTELNNQPRGTCCDTDLKDYNWLLQIAIRTSEEAACLAGKTIGTPDTMFMRIFGVEK
jgi:hypothetical protein